MTFILWSARDATYSMSVKNEAPFNIRFKQ